MENVWNLFNTHTNTTPSAAMGSGRGQNGHFSNNNWGEAWDLGNAHYDWAHGTGLASCDHALVAHDHQAPLYGSGSQYYYQDPHLACLYLGKRHYFEDSTLTNERHMEEKRGRPVAGVGVSRCQVEGCHVALMDAKEYHRRHKVCEMHSKAPRVVVLGVEQRFCQQCSRFHAISEFDDSKRSCRRRLAGHNERRRKGSHENAIMPNNSSQGRALSLLSSKNSVWLSSSADLSTRGSAALHELIAEHRASNFARQIVLDRDRSINNQYEHSMKLDDTTINNFHDQYYSEPQGWPRYNEGSNGHVTLDLMQAQSSAFGLLSVGGKSKDEEEGCSELVWRSLGGSHEM